MNGPRSSGSCVLFRLVWLAIMPHPMSTPMADGMTAPFVGITDPTVEPIPRWASGISATCPSTMGRRDSILACSRVFGSISDAQLYRRSLILITVSPFCADQPGPSTMKAPVFASIAVLQLITRHVGYGDWPGEGLGWENGLHSPVQSMA